MTREIKFRAWDSYSKSFITMELSDDPWECAVLTKPEDTDLLYQPRERHELKLDWEQFTGLHDKNGVEIYEGDIITRNSGGLMGDGEPIYTGKIAFRRLSFMVVYSSVKVQNTDLVEVVEHEGHLVNSSELEVIGNVYENPELLEAQS